MIDMETLSYSQAGQDLFVLTLLGENYKGVFLDVGCRLPKEINNTMLLESKGWEGVSIDIVDYSKEWKESGRRTMFIQADALTYNYNVLGMRGIVHDYLSLDIEGEGLRYQALKRIMDLGLKFRIITIEHDAYMGYEETERAKQRALLSSLGYIMLYPNVTIENRPFEDWWIDPEEISAAGILRAQEIFGPSPSFRDPDRLF